MDEFDPDKIGYEGDDDRLVKERSRNNSNLGKPLVLPVRLEKV